MTSEENLENPQEVTNEKTSLKEVFPVAKDVEPEKSLNIFKNVPQWFGLTAGIVYSTGFLIVSLHLDNLGLRDSGAEFFKIRYFQVGILYLLFPVSLIIPAYSVEIIRRHRKKFLQEKNLKEGKEEKEKDNTLINIRQFLATLILLNMLVAFAIVATLAPREFYNNHALCIQIIFFSTVFGLLIMRYVERRCKWQLPGACRWRIFILIFLFVMDVFLLKDLRFALRQTWLAWSFLSGFLFLIGYTFWKIRALIEEPEFPPKTHFPLWLIGLCVAGASYYLSLLPFAYGIYPHIPAYRGGGDYVELPTTFLYFKDSLSSIPPDILGNKELLKSKPLKIIEESTTSVYVIIDSIYPNPSTKSERSQELEKIIGIHRDTIVAMEYQKTKVKGEELKPHLPLYRLFLGNLFELIKSKSKDK